VRAHALLIVPVRFALGIAGLAGAWLRSVSVGAGLGLFGLGAGLFLFMMLTSRRRRLFWHRVGEAQPADPARPVEDWPRTLAQASFPSTIAVSALTAIALAANPGLAAVTAGILGGMGVGGLIFGMELMQWERSRGVRLLATPGLRSQLFVRQAA
jgi:hypothetical protein